MIFYWLVNRDGLVEPLTKGEYRLWLSLMDEPDESQAFEGIKVIKEEVLSDLPYQAIG